MSLAESLAAVDEEEPHPAVTEQTIKSLQKIESAVERLSIDTRELIKTGWDRMLGSVSTSQPGERDGTSELAAGIAAELKAEFTPLIRATDQAQQESLQQRLAEALQTLESSLRSMSQGESSVLSRSVAIDTLRSRVESLSGQGLALLNGILSGQRHIEPQQYRELRDGPLGAALREVRRAGLLVPVVAVGRSNDDPPVYFLPGLATRYLPAVLSLVPLPAQPAQDRVRDELQRIGYSDDTA